MGIYTGNGRKYVETIDKKYNPEIVCRINERTIIINDLYIEIWKLDCKMERLEEERLKLIEEVEECKNEIDEIYIQINSDKPYTRDENPDFR